jgi:hypothetical protein
MDGGGRFQVAWRASAGSSAVGAAAMGGAACVAPLPHRGDVTGKVKEKQERAADARAPHGGDRRRGVGGSWAGWR